jgi:hypothetical protein
MPFVGASGKFLDKMLEGINLKREDVYITRSPSAVFAALRWKRAKKSANCMVGSLKHRHPMAKSVSCPCSILLEDFQILKQFA